MPRYGINIHDEEVGLLKIGTIVGFDSSVQPPAMQVVIKESVLNNNPAPINVPAPYSLFYNNGLFIGTVPTAGTPVVIGQGRGGRHFFVSFLAENVPVIPQVEEDTLLISANYQTQIKLAVDNSISIGSDAARIHIDTDLSLISQTFNSNFSFTQASRKINSKVKRDLRILNDNKFDQDSKLEDDSYDSYYYEIGLDPQLTTSSVANNSNRNPSFMEDRSLVYEFEYDANVSDEISESNIYGKSQQEPKDFNFPNRRKSRADVLSLTLLEPNYLMETIKGTVVDIFGNLLDINRMPLPLGTDKSVTLNVDKAEDKEKAYKNIREIQRRGVAYHFELNARKDLSGKNGKTTLPDINSSDDYARNRSRFFVDIDKEGQFKINVPASSEKGNVPLLVRYENYSSFGDDDNNNPNKLVYIDDNKDIFLDSFAATVFTKDASFDGTRGVITIKDDVGEAGPIDRIVNTHMKHGSAYHDILSTCFSLQSQDFLQYQANTTIIVESTEQDVIDLTTIPDLKNVVSDTIIVSGDNANAGGRSGQINLDGSIELNIGANTVDRQSVWLDTAGGIVGNIGRDRNDRSLVMSLNGQVLIDIGGYGVPGDSRFSTLNNASVPGVLDIRVMTAGFQTHMIRIDDSGMRIMTPSRLEIHSAKQMVLKSDSTIIIEGEEVRINNRGVLKESGGSV